MTQQTPMLILHYWTVDPRVLGEAAGRSADPAFHHVWARTVSCDALKVWTVSRDPLRMFHYLPWYS